jgi:hypothetical protein
MTHSAIGSYCGSLGEMLCPLSAVAEFPPSLNAWYYPGSPPTCTTHVCINYKKIRNAYYGKLQAGVTVTYLRSYVTGSNDVILTEAGRTTAVSLVRAHHGPGGASEHSFGTPRGPAGQRQSRGLV